MEPGIKLMRTFLVLAFLIGFLMLPSCMAKSQPPLSSQPGEIGQMVLTDPYPAPIAQQPVIYPHGIPASWIPPAPWGSENGAKLAVIPQIP